MQKDMHFYGTYAVARIAGFSPDEARTIATAAQFVDDATDERPPQKLAETSYFFPVTSAHKVWELWDNVDEKNQWQVWLPFHFLPGGGSGRVDERLICLKGEPGNVAADAVIDLALRTGGSGENIGLHMLGIVTHVIQDTYAHYGFAGIESSVNKVDQDTLGYYEGDEDGDLIADWKESLADQASSRLLERTQLGHAAALEYPDTPYLHWGFKYEERILPDVDYLHSSRRNQDTFFKACTRLHAIYSSYIKGLSSMEGVEGHLPFRPADEAVIKSILRRDGEEKERSAFWKRAIASEVQLFEPIGHDFTIDYTSNGWTFEALGDGTFAAMTDASKFHRAAFAYRNAVLGEILPAMGILA